MAKIARENQKTRDQAEMAIKQIEDWRDAKVGKNDSFYSYLEHELLLTQKINAKKTRNIA
ncbi:hypothetical protein [Lacticaseibacillus manihotivorans]|uniref:hypothetical protein n=1 Tax=Lacticaseibacillus manihotivorans TaxID=88233 RepID=UPI0006D27AF1|nr:hypothetical protein [Lacticaseibacillus manihotivorans]